MHMLTHVLYLWASVRAWYVLISISFSLQPSENAMADWSQQCGWMCACPYTGFLFCGNERMYSEYNSKSTKQYWIAPWRFVINVQQIIHSGWWVSYFSSYSAIKNSLPLFNLTVKRCMLKYETNVSSLSLQLHMNIDKESTSPAV